MPMCPRTDDTLLPPPHEIHARLTLLAREQRRLRTLLRLIIEARDDATILRQTRHEADGRGVVHED
jgi:hypothetical protein